MWYGFDNYSKYVNVNTEQNLIFNIRFVIFFS